MAVSTLLRRVGRLLTNPSEGGQLVFIGKGDRKPPKQVDMGNSGLYVPKILGRMGDDHRPNDRAGAGGLDRRS